MNNLSNFQSPLVYQKFKLIKPDQLYFPPQMSFGRTKKRQINRWKIQSFWLEKMIQNTLCQTFSSIKFVKNDTFNSKYAVTSKEQQILASVSAISSDNFQDVCQRVTAAERSDNASEAENLVRVCSSITPSPHRKNLCSNDNDQQSLRHHFSDWFFFI